MSCAPGGLDLSPGSDRSADAVVTAAQARYRRPLWSEATGEPRGSTPLIADAAASRIDDHGEWLSPRFAPEVERAAVHRAVLRLPARASAPLHLEDVETGMAIDVALAGAEDVPAEIVGGYVVYRGAARGADVLHRAVPEGTEDYVLFERAPASPEVVYEVRLAAGVAGLRLVDGVLELLDAAGTPRLHVARPYLVDAAGVFATASLALEGCAADTSPVPPWGRAVTPPGAGRCTVRISWQGAEITYPALLDPLWSSAGLLASGTRGQHRANVLADGRVLLTGGQQGSGVGIGLTEIYDPATSTWSTTGPLNDQRYLHTATTLTDGKVLVAGGTKDATTQYLASAEIYDPAAGTWSFTGAMPVPVRSHVAAVLMTGKVVAASGGSGGVPQTAAALYDPATGVWTATPAMKAPRYGASGAVLDDGRFLVAGGYDVSSVGLVSAELYDPVANTWTTTGTMGTNRGSFQAVKLLGGKVLAIGGLVDQDSTADVDLYDPMTEIWTPVAPMTIDRDSHTATLLQSGFVLVAGGENYLNYHASSELYDPSNDTWTESATMSVYRVFHSASLLDDGSVLAAGGRDSMGGSAERYTPYAAGTFCAIAGECLSGFCVQDYCCDTECDGVCTSCLGADTGLTNGICGPHPAGTDPENDCDDDGAPSCQYSGFCDGAGLCQKYASSSGCTPSKCTDDAECSSGHCADGICCDQACDGDCESCLAAIRGSGVDGECGPIVKGTDPDNDCGDDGSTNCDKILLCDGAGKCVPSLDACAPFVCLDAHGCKSSCNSDADCASGLHCKEAKCVELQASCEGDVAISPDGQGIPCAPYGCDDVAHTCRTSCESVSDCAAPNVCDASKHCVSPPSKPAAADDGCGCRLPGRAGGEGEGWTLLLGLAALTGLRRRDRR